MSVPLGRVRRRRHHIDDLRDVLGFHRALMAGAPDELACYAIPLHVPPAEPFPSEFHGEPAVALAGCYAGPVEDGRTALEPIAAFGDPILSMAEPMPFELLQQSFDAGAPDGARYYFKAHMLREMTDEVIDAVVDNIGSLPAHGVRRPLRATGRSQEAVGPREPVPRNLFHGNQTINP